jgi:hypothetical protein
MGVIPFSLRRRRDADRPTAQLSIPESVVPIVDAAEWISIFDRLDSSKPGKFDDFTKIGRAAIHAGGELSTPRHFVQSKRYCLERRTDERQPAKSRQSGNPGLQRLFSTDTVEDERRTSAGGEAAYLFRRSCVAWHRVIRAVLLRKFEVPLVIVSRDDSGRAQSPQELNSKLPQTADADYYCGRPRHQQRQGWFDRRVGRQARVREWGSQHGVEVAHWNSKARVN